MAAHRPPEAGKALTVRRLGLVPYAILYRFFWMDPRMAREKLSFGMEVFLDRIGP